MESIAIENALEGNSVAEASFPVISKPDWGLTTMSCGEREGDDAHEYSTFATPLSTLNSARSARLAMAGKEQLEAIEKFSTSRTNPMPRLCGQNWQRLPAAKDAGIPWSRALPWEAGTTSSLP